MNSAPLSALPFSLIATDLDGTLLRAGDTVSARSYAALATARAAGAQHIIVTGRPVPQVRHVLDDLGYTGLAVCGQGAQVYDTARGRLLHSVEMDRELAEVALGKIEAEIGEVYAAVDGEGVDAEMLMAP
ncbi:HAD family hydrolase, partial [Streptomyces sp. NPDC059456]|uniref:HAD family hydrolase n=1 Tax=Streptomyces sp. NPDC059456 TaxID=3346838 RepID=UPI003678D821